MDSIDFSRAKICMRLLAIHVRLINDGGSVLSKSFGKFNGLNDSTYSLFKLNIRRNSSFSQSSTLTMISKAVSTKSAIKHYHYTQAYQL